MKPSSKKSNSKIYPYFLLFLQPVFMSSNLIIARGGVEFVPPISLAFWRWVTTFLLLIPFFYKPILKNFQKIKPEFFKLFFLGLMGCGICGAFPFIAGKTTTMANMGIIYTSSPVFIILLSTFILKELIKTKQIFGLVICIVGVLAIICKGDLNLLINTQFTSGDIWMLGAALGWALYSVYLIHWKFKFSFFIRFTLISFFGALSLFPFYVMEEILMNRTNFDIYFTFWVLFGAISPGVIAFTLYAKAQKYLGASITGFTLYLYTIYAAIYGIIFFGEQLQNFHYLGASLVLIGVYFAKKT